MNFYEELGVSPNASIEEIRHSYKVLARLLHPDQFPDQSLKQLADLQMKRLNQILAVLADPEERLRYNLSLKAPIVVPNRLVREAPPRRAPERFWSRPLAAGLCAWVPPVAGALLFVGALIYYGATAGAPGWGPSAEEAAQTRLEQPTVAAPKSSRVETARVAEGGREELLTE